MLKWTIITAIVLSHWCRAQELLLPESPRVRGMGGAYVALADDPQAGFLNPGGISMLTRMVYDGFFSTATQHGTDLMMVGMANPRNDEGSAFGTGFWTQGVLRNEEIRYYVPYAGTGWNPLGIVNTGTVFRFPVRDTKADSVKTKTFAIVDFSLMLRYRSFGIAGLVERLLGGAGDDIPRALRWGVSSKPVPRLSMCYEWRSENRPKDYEFHRGSSRLGAEVWLGAFTFLRGGYIWADRDRYAFGVSAGASNAGWRLEGGWDLPTSGTGDTRWSVGLAYRYFELKSITRGRRP